MSEISPRLDELLGYLDETRARLLETVTGINPALVSIKPHGEAWSAALIVEHHAKVEDGIVRMIERSVEWARANGVGPATSSDSILSSLDKFNIVEAATTLSAPDIVTPKENLQVDQSLGKLAESRARLRAVIVSSADVDLSQVKRPHRAMGELDMFQWALFVGQHEERHRRQIERTIVEVTERCAECAPIV